MNLPPSWVGRLRAAGVVATHWSNVGDGRATDREIMRWAEENGCVVITSDLDFAAILAATNATAPSVIQIRGRDLLAEPLLARTLAVLTGLSDELLRGAIVSIDETSERVRVLPLRAT